MVAWAALGSSLLVVSPLLGQINPQLTADELAQAALDHFQTQQNAEGHYAVTEDRVSVNRNKKERINYSDVSRFEWVVVDGKRYLRTYVMNGKDLKNKENRWWGSANTINEPKPELVPTRFHLPLAFTTAFEHRLSGHQVIAGHDCFVLDSYPKLRADPDVNDHVRLWLDAATLEVWRYQWKSLTDGSRRPSTGLVVLQGSGATIEYKAVDGVPLPSTEVYISRFHSRVGDSETRTDVTYSKYQKFSATIKVLPE